jgi:hypothetical protein
MVGLFDRLSNLLARFRHKPEAEPKSETALIAAQRLGIRPETVRPAEPRPEITTTNEAAATTSALADLRRAMAAADKRQARTDADASLLLAVLTSKGHGLTRVQALRMHDCLMRGGLQDADRQVLRRLYRNAHGREFACRIPAPTAD